jgi:EpsI family protein
LFDDKVYVSLIIGFVLAIGFVLFVPMHRLPTVISTNLDKLPREINGYYGQEDDFPIDVTRELNCDVSVVRHYSSEADDRINLYIGYYGTAKGGRTGHNPYACLPGAGWGIVESHKIRIKLTPNQEQSINYINAQKDDAKMVILHWYQSAGSHVLDSGFQQNWCRLYGRLLYNRDDGAFIQLSKDYQSLAERESATESLIKFASCLIPILPNYWPVEN